MKFLLVIALEYFCWNVYDGSFECRGVIFHAILGQNDNVQNAFVSSSCFANICSVRKILDEVEEINKTRPKKETINVSAMGLQTYALEIKMMGWMSGTVVMM